MELTVYLAGQIHDNWRDEIKAGARDQGLPYHFVGPQEDHPLSDAIGENILGEQPNARWKDETASQVNNLRTSVMLSRADVVVACFGDKYRQWNCALDIGMGIAMGKPVVVIRPPELHHALKEVSQRAQLTVDTPAQALQALGYILA